MKLSQALQPGEEEPGAGHDLCQEDGRGADMRTKEEIFHNQTHNTNRQPR